MTSPGATEDVIFQVEIVDGKVLVLGKLPKAGHGVLRIWESNPTEVKRPAQVQLPLIQGDGSRIVNPTPEELDEGF